ncbi:Uncharacterised protein [Escherichia coli]|uniref:Uncharacterized protein n=1 Tax=Escherichia coli TaxID=562 RepID=A0AB38F270_ECOLX|nr:Uncharacterised protein [Escherichia coli]
MRLFSDEPRHCCTSFAGDPNGLINANRIEIARKNHITHRGTDPVIQMQTTADVTDMLFDVPDGFAAAATSAEKRQIVAVTLRMIASNQA